MGSGNVHRAVPVDGAEHERLLAQFIDARYRTRFRTLLSGRGRARLLRGLAHFTHLDRRVAQCVPYAKKHTEWLSSQLRRYGAPATCYVVSENAEIDGRYLLLEEALDAVIDSANGTFLSCLPGQLGYFEGEDVTKAYILVRKP